MPSGPALLLCLCERQSRISYPGKGQDRFSPTHATRPALLRCPGTRYGASLLSARPSRGGTCSRSSHPWSWLTHAPPPVPALPLSSPQGQLSLPHCPGEGQDQYSRVTSAREGRGQLCNSAALRSLDVAPSCSPDQGLPRGLWWSHGPQTSTQTAVAARPGPRHGPGWQHRLFLATPLSPVLPLFIVHKPFHFSFSTTPCTCSL